MINVESEVDTEPLTEEEDLLSSSKSLDEKFDAGFDKFSERVKQQIENVIREAEHVDEKGNRAPEVRLGRISSNGRVRLEFTNPMIFPSLEEFVEMNNRSSSSSGESQPS